MRITYGCYRFLGGVNLMGAGGSQVSFLSLNTLHVCWEQSGSASAQLEALPRPGDGVYQTELLSPSKPCDREAWKYLAPLGTEKKFNSRTRKAYNTINCWLIHMFPTLWCTLSHSFVLASRTWLTEVHHRETGGFDKQTAATGVHAPVMGSVMSLHLWGDPLIRSFWSDGNLNF